MGKYLMMHIRSTQYWEYQSVSERVFPKDSLLSVSRKGILRLLVSLMSILIMESLLMVTLRIVLRTFILTGAILIRINICWMRMLEWTVLQYSALIKSLLRHGLWGWLGIFIMSILSRIILQIYSIC